MKVASTYAATEAGTDQLAAGLQAGIEGGTHAATEFWQQQAHQPEFGFLSLYAQNAFNELDHNMMLYVVCHLWPAGARFTFNCYQYQAVIHLHDAIAGIAHTLLSKTGVTQGDPIAMLLYSITVLPLIRRLRELFSDLLHIWYANDGDAAGPIPRLRKFLSVVQHLGEPYGHKVQVDKCKLITPQANLRAATRSFPQRHTSSRYPRLKIVHGARFLGSFLGEPDLCHQWIDEKTTSWLTRLSDITCLVAPHKPHAAYTTVQKSLQCEWTFLQ